jgi:SMC interacting uncharacterized protein involved in chromosome segregation
MTVSIEDQQVRLSRRALAAVRELRKVNAELDELKAKAKAKRDIIESELAGVELGGKLTAVDGHGHPLATLKSAIRQNVNMSLLRKRAPEIVSECTVETEVRTFTLLGEK